MLKNIKSIVILLLFAACIYACNHKSKEGSGVPEKFDKTKWQTGSDGDYPYRDQMLGNLLYTDTIRRLKRDAILNLLGEPTRSDTSFLFYLVKQQTFAGMIPLHTKTLVIKFRPDSSVAWIKVHE